MGALVPERCDWINLTDPGEIDMFKALPGYTCELGKRQYIPKG